MRAALYARKSQANEEAVAGQLANARAFAETKSFTVVREFTDDGISGAEFLARPCFAALLAAVKATPRPFDVVITMNVDRVGREAYRTNIALLEIAEAGIERPGVMLRIGSTDSGLEIFPDTLKNDDQIIEHDGRAVLLIDQEVSETLADTTIDVEEHADGVQVVVWR